MYHNSLILRTFSLFLFETFELEQGYIVTQNSALQFFKWLESFFHLISSRNRQAYDVERTKSSKSGDDVIQQPTSGSRAHVELTVTQISCRGLLG